MNQFLEVWETKMNERIIVGEQKSGWKMDSGQGDLSIYNFQRMKRF